MQSSTIFTTLTRTLHSFHHHEATHRSCPTGLHPRLSDQSPARFGLVGLFGWHRRISPGSRLRQSQGTQEVDAAYRQGTGTNEISTKRERERESWARQSVPNSDPPSGSRLHEPSRHSPQEPSQPRLIHAAHRKSSRRIVKSNSDHVLA